MFGRCSLALSRGRVDGAPLVSRRVRGRSQEPGSPARGAPGVALLAPTASRARATPRKFWAAPAVFASDAASRLVATFAGQEVLVRDVQLLAAQRAHLLVAVRHDCAALLAPLRFGLALPPPKLGVPSLQRPKGRLRLAVLPPANARLGSGLAWAVGLAARAGARQKAREASRADLLEFSGRLAASAGLAKTSERNQREGANLLVSLWPLACSGARQRLPIYELVRRL